MLMTKREDVTKQGSVKHSEENSVFREVSYWSLFIFGGWERGGGGWVLVVGAYLRLSGKGRGWALINLFCL